MSHTIRFRVGGIPLEISAKLLERFPNSGLYHFARQQPNDPPFLLDHNPFAFLVILDFLRTDGVYIPRNVNTDLVKRLFQHYGLPLDGIVELETESVLPGATTFSTETPRNTNPFASTPTEYMQSSSYMSAFISGPGTLSARHDLPPAYTTSSISSPSLGGKSLISRGIDHYLNSLDSQQKTTYKKLEPMIFGHLLPLLTSHIDQGHERLRVYFAPIGVAKESIANDTHAEDIGFPKEVFAPSAHGIDVVFLAQPKVMELFKKILLFSTGIEKISHDIRSITSRVENPFGLYESMSFDVPVLTFVFSSI